MVLPTASMKLPITESNERLRLNCLMAATVLSLVATDLILAKVVHLNIREELNVLAHLSVGSFGVWVLTAAYCYCRWRGEGLSKLGDIAQLAAWSLLAIPAISFLIPAAGRSRSPTGRRCIGKNRCRLAFPDWRGRPPDLATSAPDGTHWASLTDRFRC